MELRKERIFSRESMLLGVLACTIVVGVLVGVIIANGFDYVLRSDAQHYYRVALDPFGTGKTFLGAPLGSGIAYRYGRILYPLFAWLLAAGRPNLIRWTLPAVYIFGLWLMVASACELCRAHGKEPIRGLIVLLVPSIWLTVPLLVPEMFEVGLIMLLYLLVIRGENKEAKILAAVMLLMKETTILALLPIVLYEAGKKNLRGVATWALSALPLLAWWSWVRLRIGTWPFRDTAAINFRPPLALPWNGFISAPFRGSHDGFLLFAVGCAALTVVIASWLAVQDSWYPLTYGTLVVAALMLFFGAGPVVLPGDAFRLMLPAEVLTAVVVLTRLRKTDFGR